MKDFSNHEFKAFLETEVLYKKVTFEKSFATQETFMINEIDSYCEQCESIRPFHDMRSRGGGAGNSFVQAPKERMIYHEFKCVSCKTEKRMYFVNQVVTDTNVTFEKVGEMPRQKLERDKLLEKFFVDDSDNYHKAVVCLANGYGVAAFAYMRRIIENNIEKLLELISEEVASNDSDQELMKSLSELRKESPMSDKIKIANKALPSYLKPDGLNPLGRLYQQLSEGVHSLPDDECLKKASSLKACIKFLISELSSRKHHRDNFNSLINNM
nr:hypothetical protein [uncultured Shewanella sp.]